MLLETHKIYMLLYYDTLLVQSFVVYADTNVDPRQCTPDTAAGTCHKHATCTQVTPHVCACNPASSYRCKCSQGYKGDGLTCKGKPFATVANFNLTHFQFQSVRNLIHRPTVELILFFHSRASML